MRNALHERLEYLINYSSQLIFVSGDSIAQQQKTLDSFIFHQPDGADVAMLTATREMTLSDYRRQICRQLYGQVVGSYVRPLKDLLAPAVGQSNTVLITIVQSQCIPNELLQELWDLVLQSRTQTHAKHLNVLLFGESAWATQAKHWLPSANTDRPLLISSQSIDAPAFDENTQAAVAKRREQFQQYLNKYSRNTQSRPLVILSIILVILVCVPVYFWQIKTSSSSSPSLPPTETIKTEDNTLTLNSRPLGAGIPDLYPDEQTAAQIEASTELSPPSTEERQSQAIIEVPEPAVQVEPSPTTLHGIRVLEMPEQNATYIQLASLQDEKVLVSFVQERVLQERALVYVGSRGDKRSFYLVFNKSYPSRIEAEQALANVREETGITGAFLKSADTINSELLRSSDGNPL